MKASQVWSLEDEGFYRALRPVQCYTSSYKHLEIGVHCWDLGFKSPIQELRWRTTSLVQGYKALYRFTVITDNEMS
jgi:hypothetical protein